jgi:hypothetical protein
MIFLRLILSAARDAVEAVLGLVLIVVLLPLALSMQPDEWRP